MQYAFIAVSVPRPHPLVVGWTLQQGLLWTLANDAAVPASVRMALSEYGLCKDEFVSNDNWLVNSVVMHFSFGDHWLVNSGDHWLVNSVAWDNWFTNSLVQAS
jgi:hypothetical protein